MIILKTHAAHGQPRGNMELLHEHRIFNHMRNQARWHQHHVHGNFAPCPPPQHSG